MPLVLGVLVVAFVASFVVTSLRTYGGFNYVGHSTSLSNAIMQSLGAVFLFPVIHLAIASIWKSKRNSRSRRNIFFGWGVAVVIIQIFNFTQISGFMKSKPVDEASELVLPSGAPKFEGTGIPFELGAFKVGDTRDSVVAKIPGVACRKGERRGAENCSGRGSTFEGIPILYTSVDLYENKVERVGAVVETSQSDEVLAAMKLKYGRPIERASTDIRQQLGFVTWTNGNGESLEFQRAEGPQSVIFLISASYAAKQSNTAKGVRDIIP